MDLLARLNELVDLIQKEGNEHLYDIAVDLQKEIIQLIETNQILQKKVETHEGCYWAVNSDGG